MTQTTVLPARAPSGDFADRALRQAAMAAGFLSFLGLAVAAMWIGLKWLPDQLSFGVLGHALHLRNIHSRIIDAGSIGLLLPLALWLECAIVGWRRSSVRELVFARSASARTDIAYFCFGQLQLADKLGQLMALGASIISGLWIRDWVKAHLGLAIDPSGLPFAAQISLYFFAYTFFDYWTHRLNHSRYFWPLHRYHHAAEDFCIVTAVRAHPAEVLPGTFFINIPMAVLGAPVDVLVYVNVAMIALGFLIHSRIDSDFGWIGRYVIQSPNHHRLHHKLDMSEPTGHFSMAPIWDRMFGTWRGDADQSLVIGVETPYRHGFWIAPDLLRDYFDFWRGLVWGPRGQASATAGGLSQ